MTKLKLTFAAALLLGSTFAFAGTPKTDAKAKSDTKSDAKVEAKTEAKTDAKTETTLYYWFDAVNGSYKGHSETTDCPKVGTDPCANGYINVSNPSNPIEPNQSPQKVETEDRS